jgi:hypothetical protein
MRRSEDQRSEDRGQPRRWAQAPIMINIETSASRVSSNKTGIPGSGQTPEPRTQNPGTNETDLTGTI